MFFFCSRETDLTSHIRLNKCIYLNICKCESINRGICPNWVGVLHSTIKNLCTALHSIELPTISCSYFLTWQGDIWVSLIFDALNSNRVIKEIKRTNTYFYSQI